jgi:hypothetical protein
MPHMQEQVAAISLRAVGSTQPEAKSPFKLVGGLESAVPW